MNLFVCNRPHLDAAVWWSLSIPQTLSSLFDYMMRIKNEKMGIMKL